MFGVDALKLCLTLPHVQTVLDVGSGHGEHARTLRYHGKQVTTIDHSAHLGQPDILADFNEYPQTLLGRYDLVWACHVLEHQRNPGRFLEKLKECCRAGGYLAVTVPPAKHEIVGGHVTLWNAGLLLYNLVLAGIDCRRADVHQYGYNISVVVPYTHDICLDDRGLVMDAGDLEKLQDFFPLSMTQNTRGDFTRVAGRFDTLSTQPED